MRRHVRKCQARMLPRHLQIFRCAHLLQVMACRRSPQRNVTKGIKEVARKKRGHPFAECWIGSNRWRSRRSSIKMGNSYTLPFFKKLNSPRFGRATVLTKRSADGFFFGFLVSCFFGTVGDLALCSILLLVFIRGLLKLREGAAILAQAVARFNR